MQKTRFVVFFFVWFIQTGYGQDFSLIEKNKSLIENKKEVTLSNSDTSKVAKWLDVKSVYLYGGGKLLNLVTTNDKVEDAASPSGSLGFYFETDRLKSNLYFSYNARQTLDMQSLSNFGNSLINPDRGGQSFTFSARGSLVENFGFTTSFSVSDQEWILNDTETVDASPIVSKIGFYLEPFRFNLTDNSVEFIIDLHYTNRVISGDFGNSDQVIEDMIIKRRGYNGWDIQANMKFNAVKVYVQFSGNTVRDLDIPGFSGHQVLFGVEVSGPLVKIK